MDQLSNYDYDLPQELIASRPCERRDAARLLVVDRDTGKLHHKTMGDLPDLLQAGDCLALNDTRVVPARLFGRRAKTGGKWEGLFLSQTASGMWRLMSQCRGKPAAGERITVVPTHKESSGETLSLTLLAAEPEGIWVARPELAGDALELLARFGTVPLPPYIRRRAADALDWERYQTTFARRPGAVAAPTAGLHFTPELLDACCRRGIRRAFVTLHVGLGTFRPITAEKLSQHRMHAEWCELPRESADTLVSAKTAGGRVVAVGTTVVRTLESVASRGPLHPWQGTTELFIRPPYRFRAVDALLTNFHLPRSTLFVLVCAFAGTDLVKRAYAAAVRERYRFYSYGDAMLIR